MSALNLNKVTLCGRLTADTELRMTQGGQPVVSFTLAVNRPRARDGAEQKADFLNCVAWDKTAEFISKYFRKGDSLYIEGSLQVRTYKTSTGLGVRDTEVNVSEARFVDSKSAAQPVNEEPSPAPIDDTDLPF